MKKYICDCCKAEVNDYAHWSKGEPRTMYELRTIHEFGESPYEGVILCQHCVEYLLWCIEIRRSKSCNTCKYNDDELSGECYECLKGIFDHYESESEVPDADNN